MIGRSRDEDTVARRCQRRRWPALAAAVALGGVLATVLISRSVSSGDASNSRRAFAGASASIAATLDLGIRREQDLVLSAAGFFLQRPGATSSQFRAWSRSIRVMQRFPELDGWGEVVVVPAHGLSTYEALVSRDPPSAFGAAGHFVLIPAGRRPYYCFNRAGQERNAHLGAPPGYDFCAGHVATVNFAARDSGRSVYAAINTGAGDILGVAVPFYRGGGLPPTVAARRRAFVGWVGMGLDPQTLLAQATAGHPGVAVTLRYRAGSAGVRFRRGAAAPGAARISSPLASGWTLATFEPVASGSVLADGNALALLIVGIALSAALGALILVLGTGRERARRLVRERTLQLHHLALHDPLTELPNRTLIVDRIEQMLARSRRSGLPGAVLYLDLDEFKNVNDRLGHDAGDRLLQAVAARLRGALRGADTIGRMGGDEFVVLVDGTENLQGPELAAERLLDVMRHPFTVEGANVPLIIGTSIGIALADGGTVGELLRDADVALYEAKAAGRNGYRVFRVEMETELSRRLELEFDLRSALEEHRFRLLYQPIYQLDDLSVDGVEALLRWDHPDHGVIGPAEFIPMLERTGQIREVGRWVLREACARMAAWHAAGYGLDVSVNVSAAQLDDDGIVADVREALEASGLEPRSLIVEVTETALMRDAGTTAGRLAAIKELGARVAVDDFGTGYSSLAYLQQFPVDCLKIDRVFTRAITSSPESRALVGTLVQLGRDLGLTTLAEGVESPGQLDSLRSEGVNEIQGFLLSRPLEADAVEAQILAPAAARAVAARLARSGERGSPSGA